MTLSETIEHYIELRTTMQSDDYHERYSIPQRRMMYEEMTDLKKDIDHFENMVYDMYAMLNRHDDQLNTIAMNSL
jgi:hypothetical protein